MYLNTAAGKAQNADLPKDVSPFIARLYLNELVEKTRIELNDMIFVCKRYEGMNREIHGQVTRDISYLVEQIDDLYRMESEATSEISLTYDEIGAAVDCGAEQKASVYMWSIPPTKLIWQCKPDQALTQIKVREMKFWARPILMYSGLGPCQFDDSGQGPC